MSRITEIRSELESIVKMELFYVSGEASSMIDAFDKERARLNWRDEIAVNSFIQDYEGKLNFLYSCLTGSAA